MSGPRNDPVSEAPESLESPSLEFIQALNRKKWVKYILGLLYFSNQRPGIFVAPYLLARGWNESSIGAVLFISGLVGLVVQTPAGQIADETNQKRLIVWLCNIGTMIGCLMLLYTKEFLSIATAISLNSVCDAFIYPALYSLTLGIDGPAGIGEQAPINEMFTHCGNAFFAIAAGMVVMLTSSGFSIYWICIVIRGFGCLLTALIRKSDVDYERARGLELVSGAKVDEPMNYLDIFLDYHVVIFLLCVLLFHFSNAAMLPLLSQQLFISNSEKGFEFAALAVVIAEGSMVLSSMLAGVQVPLVGVKPLFLIALAAIPIRGFIIVVLLSSDSPNNALLLATQILDGVAGGIFGVVVVLLAESLARGSGRFACLVGMAKTAEGIGASFSNLVGEVLAEHYGYRAAFGVLGLCATFPIFVYALFMPPAKVVADGVIGELRAVSISKGGIGTSDFRGGPSVESVSVNQSDSFEHNLHGPVAITGTQISRGGRMADAARRTLANAVVAKGYHPVGLVAMEPDIGRRYVLNPLGSPLEDDDGAIRIRL